MYDSLERQVGGHPLNDTTQNTFNQVTLRSDLLFIVSLRTTPCVSGRVVGLYR
jgi:hypothetical protein